MIIRFLVEDILVQTSSNKLLGEQEFYLSATISSMSKNSGKLMAADSAP
jgi:hypothetical protein